MLTSSTLGRMNEGMGATAAIGWLWLVFSFVALALRIAGHAYRAAQIRMSPPSVQLAPARVVTDADRLRRRVVYGPR